MTLRERFSRFWYVPTIAQMQADMLREVPAKHMARKFGQLKLSATLSRLDKPLPCRRTYATFNPNIGMPVFYFSHTMGVRGGNGGNAK